MKTDRTNYAWTQGVISAACYVTHMQFVMQGVSFSHSTGTVRVKAKKTRTCLKSQKLDRRLVSSTHKKSHDWHLFFNAVTGEKYLSWLISVLHVFGPHKELSEWKRPIWHIRFIYSTVVLLAPTGALIVIVVYYTSGRQGHFLRFWAFLPIYLVFLFENWMQIDNNWPWGPWWL